MKKNKKYHYYPIALRLSGRNVVVVGGGKVAERKVGVLCNYGANIRVISPTVTDILRDLAKKKIITWVQREVHRQDLNDAYMVVAATNDEEVNRMIRQWSEEYNILTNVVDDIQKSDFISPALLEWGGGIIAIYTDGKDPVLSKDLKNFLKERWDDFLSYRNKL